jgi:hypothetical protein
VPGLTTSFIGRAHRPEVAHLDPTELQVLALMSYHLRGLACDKSDVFHETFCLTISQTETALTEDLLG